eukprot:6342107-Prymnesium_polylepis.1
MSAWPPNDLISCADENSCRSRKTAWGTSDCDEARSIKSASSFQVMRPLSSTMTPLHALLMDVFARSGKLCFDMLGDELAHVSFFNVQKTPASAATVRSSRATRSACTKFFSFSEESSHSAHVPRS